MGVERTPEELRRAAELDERTLAAVEAAIDNAASYWVADLLDETSDVCEQWVDRMWDELREALNPEERLNAIVLLIADEARTRASMLLQEVAE